MKILTSLIVAALMTGFFSCDAQTMVEKEDSKGYRLVWGDEFEVDGRPNPDKWDYETGFIRNEEPQWYQPENAYCADGKLIIEAKQEKKANPNYNPSSDNWKQNREFAHYTSACLISLRKFDFKYGKVTMRAKIDTDKGMWPAFWMLGSRRSKIHWPACGELDIMEFYRGKLLANAAWQGENGTAWDTSELPLSELGANWAGEFHVWQMLWNESKIELSVDGKLLNSIDLEKTINPTNGDNAFHHNFYLLLNFALGQAGEEIPDENLPAKLIVDYVRVFQNKG